MARERAVRLSDHLWRIPTLPLDLLNSFAFVEDDGSVTLVDCGLKRAPFQIVAGLAAMGRAPGDVRRIVITHAHVDHAGGLPEVRRRSGDPPVDVHVAEARFVREGLSPPPDTSLTVGRLMDPHHRGRAVQHPGHPVAVRPGVHERRAGAAHRAPAHRPAVLARRLHSRP